MNGNNCRSSIRVLQEMVATFDPDFFKTNPDQQQSSARPGSATAKPLEWYT
jgi:hypothetical protein